MTKVGEMSMVKIRYGIPAPILQSSSSIFRNIDTAKEGKSYRVRLLRQPGSLVVPLFDTLQVPESWGSPRWHTLPDNIEDKGGHVIVQTSLDRDRAYAVEWE